MPRTITTKGQARINSRVFTPTPAQRPIWESNARIVAAIAGHFGGKPLALETPVPTSSGWTTMGAIKVGDELFDDQGNICHVTAVHPIVDDSPCYELVFSDGAKIIADAEHRWLTWDWKARRSRAKQTSPRVVNTEEIANSLYAYEGPRRFYNHAIPVAAPLCLPVADLPIDPYVLGVWLGDGASYHATLSCSEPEILREIEKAGYNIWPAGGQDYRIGAGQRGSGDPGDGRSLQGVLRQLGLLQNKHIPMAYLRGSIEQRLALLQGLMDTDGTVLKDGRCRFANTNEKLARDVFELVCSLGMKPTLRPCGTTKRRDGSIVPVWVVQFRANCMVVRLSRKAARLCLAGRQNRRFRMIVAARRVPSVPVRCITVDSPSHLFLCTSSMISSFNTHLGPYWIMREAKKFPGDDFVICGPTYGTLRKAPIPKFLSLMRLLGLPIAYDRHSGVGYRPGDREYRLPQGGIVYFVTADRPGSMQGAHLRGAWIDETVDTSYEVYETLLGRVAGLQGRILITSTPYDLGWLYEHVYLRWKEGDPDIFVHQWRSIDNPKFSKEEFERIRKRLPRWRFRMLYEGQFEQPEGLVYDCFQDKHFIEPFLIPSDWERVLGIDWGFTDPMAAIWEARAPDGKRFLYDEFYRSGWMAKEKRNPEDPDEEVELDPRGAFTFPTEMLSQIVERTKSRQEYLKAVYCDPSNAAMVAQAQQLFADIGCYRVYGAKNAILPGIDRCYSLVRKGDLFVFNTLTHFRDELSKYQWKMDKSGNALRDAVPIDRNNHAMDAWRYLEAGGKDEKENTFSVGKISDFDAFGARASIREGY